MSESLTLDLLGEIARLAIRYGATDAEVVGIARAEFSAEVRLGQVEKVHESNSQGIGLRVLKDGRQATCSTSETSLAALEELVTTAVNMARLTSIDEAAQLPTAGELATGLEMARDLSLYDPEIVSLPTQRKIELARLTEEAARSADPRITNSEGAACSTVVSRNFLVNTAGFAGDYEGTVCSLMTAPIAGDGLQMQVGYRGDQQRHLRLLEGPEEIGREAARRALRKLGARKVETQSVPVVFEAEAAGDLLDSLLEAVNGNAIFRRSSFLVGQLGEEVGSSLLSVIDDGTIPGALGSRPFDGEGVPSRRTTIIDQGKLTSYLLNTYTARKLNLRTTGNAVRGLTGAPGVGPGNFQICPGQDDPAAIIKSIRNGFYVTEMIGFGFNPVTGDYSRGASGWWISEGELAFPVEEVTIAGNLREMLRGIEMVGNDLRRRGRVSAPTIRIDRLMVSGS